MSRLFWVLKERSFNRRFPFDVAPSVSYSEKAVFACLLFYTRLFPATHVHVERCDWWKSVKATSSGRIFYLSAGMSRLISLAQNQFSGTVSISCLSHLSRRPCLSRALSFRRLRFLGTALKAAPYNLGIDGVVVRPDLCSAP